MRVPQNWTRNDEGDDFEVHQTEAPSEIMEAPESETTYGEINGMSTTASTKIVTKRQLSRSISIPSLYACSVGKLWANKNWPPSLTLKVKKL